MQGLAALVRGSEGVVALNMGRSLPEYEQILETFAGTFLNVRLLVAPDDDEEGTESVILVGTDGSSARLFPTVEVAPGDE